MRKKIAVIFGGRSLESDISVITAMQVLSSIDASKYIVEPIYLFDGDFFVKDVDNIRNFVDFNTTKHKRVILHKGCFYYLRRNRIFKYFKPDCALLCCHGGEGENGIVQSLMQFNGIPYTSCGVLQSAVGMNKGVLKMLFETMMLNVLPYQTILRTEYKNDVDECVKRIENALKYPLIVKPASQGSSIGIAIAKDAEGLKEAFRIAFSFDDVAIVEHKLDNFVEVNCAVYKRKDEIVVSDTEQPTYASDFLTFQEKYMVGGKMSAGGHIVPANIGDLNNVVRKTALKIYKTLNLDGVVRIDYLVDVEHQKVYVNEINTIPGSLAYYLFESRGISFEMLLNDLIESAINVKSDTRKVYKSNVLSHFAGGGKIKK